MNRYITVMVKSTTVVDDGLGNTTETTNDVAYGNVRFAPRSSTESADNRSPKVITAAALYRRGELLVDDDDTIVIADQHPTIDGTWQVEGIPGRWASGVEVAIRRA